MMAGLMVADFKCEYSGQPFHLCRGSIYSFSVERIKNNRGHSPNNCVLILAILNSPGG